MLCCATPLDGGLFVVRAGPGATFDDVALTSWYTGGEGSDAAAEGALDGRTEILGAARGAGGAGVGGAPGTSKALLEVHRRALAATGAGGAMGSGRGRRSGEGDGPPGYRAMKAFAAAGSGYGAAKRAAMATKGVWSLSDADPGLGRARRASQACVCRQRGDVIRLPALQAVGVDENCPATRLVSFFVDAGSSR